MKKNSLLPILFCMSSVLFIMACEKAEVTNSSAKIEPRSDCVDDCNDCPVNDCCCSITITEGGETDLILCGTTDPCLSTTACRPAEAGNCIISGYTIEMTLNSAGVATGLFCVDPNSPFYIQSSNNVSARITCRVGQSPPQGVNVTFNTPPNNKAYYTVNGDCEISSCL